MSSSNPFRRKSSSQQANAPSTTTESPSIDSNYAYAEPKAEPILETSNTKTQDVPKKVTKKVRVQSPTPSSPSIPDSTSTKGDYADSKRLRPPTPPIQEEDAQDPFESASSESSEDEEISEPAKAPPNPFQKTLQTMEKTGRDGPSTTSAAVRSPGRASMDVDAFKRLLMTGNAGLGTSATSATFPAQSTHGLGDGASTTDTSSISRQSIFDAIQEVHSETPRTSHESSGPENDYRGLTIDVSTPSGRKKPPPPSSRHGKLIRIELRDDITVSPINSPPVPGSSTSQQSFNRSTDVNKPLPSSPTRASHESSPESIFDKESAGKVPEPSSPLETPEPWTAPTPVPPRHHSQMLTDAKLSVEPERLSPSLEEALSSTTETATGTLRSNSRKGSLQGLELSRPRSNSGKAPPPPPSRRSNSVRTSNNPTNKVLMPGLSGPPPPPPARSSSKRATPGNGSARPLSYHNSEKRNSLIPPPPPPQRKGRNSEDSGFTSTSFSRPSAEPSRQSIDSGRRVSEDLMRSGPGMGVEGVHSGMSIGSRSGSGGTDILADLSNLQKEIDALRSKKGEGEDEECW